jgi:hypothetical protein
MENIHRPIQRPVNIGKPTSSEIKQIVEVKAQTLYCTGDALLARFICTDKYTVYSRI